MKNSDLDTPIPKEQLTAYERWELPLLDERGNEIGREEERRVKPLTAAEISEIREAAREDGYNEGRDQGYQVGLAEGREQGLEEGRSAGTDEGREHGLQQGLADAKQDVDARLERLEHLMGELLLPIRRHDDEIESALLNLTVTLARSVLLRELSLDTTHIQQVVRRALGALPPTADNVRIHIHSQDADLVRQVAARLDTPASVVADDRLTPGGCRVETRQSLVDFSVEKRFQQSLQAMLADQASGNTASAERLGELAGDLSDIPNPAATQSPTAAPSIGTSPDEAAGKEKGDDIHPD
ncbi:flagellar assembly protein FliH [Marinobacter salinisoli]|uniref:Flagellar assembly protein FliH n=1 Tax=Marinobacter salinisoli TaxID=2769486 RepID=A0ABX7MQ00_9GAMM|nr:flagellar assembly protein FliH [Marinobacter salinisoli]QSP94407.1 flagellar assembly protein FliH [Marinobacter salinisoli]